MIEEESRINFKYLDRIDPVQWCSQKFCTHITCGSHEYRESLHVSIGPDKSMMHLMIEFCWRKAGEDPNPNFNRSHGKSKFDFVSFS